MINVITGLGTVTLILTIYVHKWKNINERPINSRNVIVKPELQLQTGRGLKFISQQTTPTM